MAVRRRRKMIDKKLVVIFDNESQAYEGARVLQEMQHEGS
jgi:hypothetical protein